MSNTHPHGRGQTDPPCVFISYSHDSTAHRLRVLSLAQQLRGDGFESHLDREVLDPEGGWIRWMWQQIKLADHVLVVCTPTYKQRAEGDEQPGKGQGANFEGLVISNEMYAQDMRTGKYIPVGFQSEDRRFVPFFLAGRTFFNVADSEDYERLCRVMAGQPDVILPPPTPTRSRPPSSIPPLHVAPRGSAESANPDSGQDPSPVRALVGLAIDVSGSMAESMPRKLGQHSSRLEAVRTSLEHVAREARELAQRAGEENASTVALFAYGFGLRIGTVCDLLSLMKVAKGVVTPEEIEEVKREVEAEAREKAAAFQELGRFAENFFGQGAKKLAEDTARRLGESAVRSRLIARARPRIEERLARTGDTTIGIGELAALWNGSGETLENASELIFGNTPMCEAFELLSRRFQRERQQLGPAAPSVLFLLSDGEPTDGNPLPLAANLRSSGVKIVSCFVTGEDIVFPRTLFTTPQPSWNAGARLMFDLASTAEPGNPFVDLLKSHGWTIPEGSRLFLQVNQSDVLEEFVRGLLGYAGDPGQTLPPRGR